MELLASSDLIFLSRIAQVAQSLGSEVQSLSSLEHLQGLEAQAPPRFLFLDLSLDATPAAWVDTARAQFPQLCIVAFGAHVDHERLDEARRAGCDLVLTRSQFVTQLPELLSSQ